MLMTRVKHRKKVRKDEMIRVLVTTEQKKRLNEAAASSGMSLSSWLLATGLRALQDAA
jgi:uncharacterized protein (DUF1778 family)